MAQKRLLTLLMLVALMLLFGAARPASADTVKLTWLTHWGTADQIKAEQAMIDEHQAAHAGVTIELLTVSFDDLLTKITASNTAGTNPDIYHIYNLWLP